MRIRQAFSVGPRKKDRPVGFVGRSLSDSVTVQAVEVLRKPPPDPPDQA